MESQNVVSEEFLEAAAGEALLCNSAADAARLAELRPVAGDAGKRAERELLETAARLAAASPYMDPPADLRGRILQATAPATFRMEDYRKKSGEDMRFYKWGFYAAAMFLMAAAIYNLYTRNTLAAAYNQQVARANTLEQQVQVRNALVSELADPRSMTVPLKDKSGQLMGKLVLDADTGHAVAIVPEGSVKTGESVQVAVTEGGKKVNYQTTTLTVQGGGMHAPAGQTLAQELNVNLSPDESTRPMQAQMP